MNERKKVPSVEGATTRWPSTSTVDPAPQPVGVVDPLASGQGRVEQRHRLVAGVGDRVVIVEVDVRGGLLRVAVRDGGRGGIGPARGSGLLGLKDRVEAIGGSISPQSPQGKGATLIAELPFHDWTA